MSNNTKMNINDFQTKVIDELAAIRAMLADNKTAAPSKPKKERKPRDPNAAPNGWIVFTGKVRNALKNAGKPAGKECQQFASYLKNDFPDAYEMDDAEIVAAHESWTPPPPKPKEDKPAETGDSKPKPKRTLSDEQKAKMAAGRKAAAERKKAEAAAANNKPSDTVEDAPAPAPAPAPTPSLPVEESKPSPTLKPLPFKGKKYLYDPEGQGMWVNNDGVKGVWAGVLAKDKKSIDASATDYTA